MFMPQAAPPVPVPAGIGMAPPQPNPVVYNDDGSIDVDLSPSDSAPAIDQLPHDTNLAEHLPPIVLSGIVNDLLEGIEADEQSCADWMDAYERGVDLLGLKTEKVDQPFEDACGVYHPLMMEAVLRFQANARAEMLPAAGPVRTQLLDTTEPGDQKQHIAIRKQQWLNYYLTHVYESYYPDFDQMLLYIAICGSCFKKVYTDPLRRRPEAPFIMPGSLIISYNARSIEEAPRLTHIALMTKGDVIRLQLGGTYRRLDLQEPEEQETTATKVRDQSDGRRREMIIGDDRHEILECHCDLDIDHPGVQHLDDDGEPSGLPLPYIVTMDRQSRAVLALRRNWNPDDEDFRRLEYFVHYKFLPGLGVLGWGYAHVLGGSAEAATSIRRQMIDGGTLSMFPGGFRVKGMRPEKSIETIGPCEFIELDTGGLPIRDAIMPLPYQPPAPVIADMLQDVVSSGQRLGQTADMNVGEGRQDAPVGTTLALIEQAVRIESAIIKRLHTAHRKELRLLASQFAKLPAGTVYPYDVDGQPAQAIAEDFANTDDIVPVSDPNVPTQLQRLAIAQAKLQLAQSAPPGMYDLREAHRGIHLVLGASPAEIDRIMPPPPQAQPLDPISENQAALMGKPLAVAPLQAHAAHIRVHMGALEMPGVAKLPAAGALISHIAEHAGWAFRQAVEAEIGQPLPPPGQPLPPQVEGQLSQHVAQVIDQVTTKLQALAGSGGDPVAAEAIKVKRLEIEMKQADAARKAQETARQDEIELEKLKATMDDNREQRQADIAEAGVKLQAEMIKAKVQLAQHEQQTVTEGIKAGAQVASAHVQAHADIRSQAEATRTEDVKGRHAVKVAEHQAKAKPKGPAK